MSSDNSSDIVNINVLDSHFFLNSFCNILCIFRAITMCDHYDLTKAGNHLYEISAAIGAYAEKFGYGVVRDLVGHGIGTSLHEDPEIPNFRQRRRGLKLQAGMTLAIEPMINQGRADVEWLDDDWTVVTEDGSLSAHYENTVLITDGEPEILTFTK